MFTNNKWLNNNVTPIEESGYINVFKNEIQRLLEQKGIFQIWGNDRKTLLKLIREIPHMKHFYEIVIRANELFKLDKGNIWSFNRKLMERLLYSVGIDPYQTRHFD